LYPLAVLGWFGGDNTATFTAVTAVVAFGISLFNLYDQRFRSVHDLDCTLVAIGYNGKKFVAHTAFENLGTHDEIVLSGPSCFQGVMMKKVIQPLLEKMFMISCPN